MKKSRNIHGLTLKTQATDPSSSVKLETLQKAQSNKYDDLTEEFLEELKEKDIIGTLNPTHNRGEMDEEAFSRLQQLVKKFIQGNVQILSNLATEEAYQSKVEEAVGVKMISIDPKAEGFNPGYIMTSEEGKRYFVKDTLNSQATGKSRLVEIFIYKLLENIGYGPKSYAIITGLPNSSSIVTEDVSTTTAKEKDGVIINKNREFTLGSDYEPDTLDISKKAAIHSETIVFLINLLNLADVKSNHGNYGVATTVSRDKELEIKRAQKPIIIDFKPQDSLPESPNDIFKGVVTERDGTFVKKIQLQAEEKAREENLQKSLERLNKGRNTKKPFAEAVEDAYEYTCKIYKEIEERNKAKNSSSFNMDSEYNLQELQEYKQGVVGRFNKVLEIAQSKGMEI